MSSNQDKRGDKWKNAFKTNKGLCESLVMHFELTNTPSTFMNLMNEVLIFLGKFLIFYLDGIFIFSRTKEEHLWHIRQVF